MCAFRCRPKLSGVAGLAVAGLMLGLLAQPVPASAARVAFVSKKSAIKCDGTVGWSAVSARPTALSRLGASGYYVWNEKGVWRVSVTHGDRRVQKFQGTITFDAPISARPVGAEGTGDVVQSTASSASFAFVNYGGVDGVAVLAPCATVVTVNGSIDGQPVTTAQIFFGPTASNPPAVPAAITKAVAATSAATASSTSPSAAQSPTVAAKDCGNVAWPSSLQGRPSVLKNNGRQATQGMYVWAEKSLLRVVLVGEAGRPVQVDGTLTANAEIRVSPVGLEGRRDALRAIGTVATFSFLTGVGLDGFDVTSPCSTQVVFEATIDDGPITVFLGPSAAAVPALPYLLTR